MTASHDGLSVNEHGLTQLVELLGRDCVPTQFVREFFKNSLEAILRVQNADNINNFEGKILVDFDPVIHERNGLFKMSFVDNGDGMTDDEMRMHLNRLSSSGHQNMEKNYGIGAKISALTRNHFGIVYKSWKNNQGFQLIISYDNDTNTYGIEPQELNGEVVWVRPLSINEKPDLIQDHGTQVILLGMEKDDDTMKMPAPSTIGGEENWLFQYLNTRFYKLPKNIEASARIAYKKIGQSTTYRGKISGQSKTLDDHTVEKEGILLKGAVQLSDALLHWRIMDPDRSGHGRQFLNGHVACLNQNEILDIKSGRSNKAADFGVFIGKEDIVFLVEPSNNYVQNTSRTGLVKADGSELPWDRWADEFREKMPQEIKDFIQERLEADAETSNSDSIKEKLRSIQNLLKVSRFRPNPTGLHSADPDSEIRSGVGQNTFNETEASRGTRSRAGDLYGPIDELLMSSEREGGETSEATAPDIWPEVHWVSPETEPNLKDRAALFIERDNKIMANQEFQGLLDVKEYFLQEYSQHEEIESIVAGIVRDLFEQQLMETVVGACSFKNRPNWTPTDFANSTSPEALSTAVMCRYHLVAQAKKEIVERIGRSRQN